MKVSDGKILRCRRRTMSAPIPEVKELLARVQQGDQAAAVAVFGLYKRQLLGLARSHLEKKNGGGITIAINKIAIVIPPPIFGLGCLLEPGFTCRGGWGAGRAF